MLLSLLGSEKTQVDSSDRVVYVIVAIFLLLGGAIQLRAAYLVMRNRPLTTTVGRQMTAAFGRRGAILAWLIVGVLLVGGGIFVTVVGLIAK